VTAPGPADLGELVARVRRLVGDGGRRTLLGVTGSPGAGKSTLVQALLAALAPDPPPGLAAGTWVAHVPMDGFHLADVELDRLGRRARKGALDTFDAWGYLALLRRLRAEEPATVYAPGFERDLEQPIAGAIPVAPDARLVLTEGNYLLAAAAPWPSVAAELDEVWFCDPDDAVRRTRLVERHVAFGKAPPRAADWVRDVDEPNARLVAATRHRADLVVPAAVLDAVGARG
jgi:pantothenate kinase